MNKPIFEPQDDDDDDSDDDSDDEFGDKKKKGVKWDAGVVFKLYVVMQFQNCGSRMCLRKTALCFWSWRLSDSSSWVNCF